MESTGQCVYLGKSSGYLRRPEGLGSIQTRTGTIERVGEQGCEGVEIHTSNAGGAGSIPGQGTTIPPPHGVAKKKDMTPNLWPTLVLSFATMWVTGQCKTGGPILGWKRGAQWLVLRLHEGIQSVMGGSQKSGWGSCWHLRSEVNRGEYPLQPEVMVGGRPGRGGGRSQVALEGQASASSGGGGPGSPSSDSQCRVREKEGLSGGHAGRRAGGGARAESELASVQGMGRR